MDPLLRASWRPTILFYLEETEHHRVQHISSIGRIEAEQYVWLDKFTIRNLELLHPQQEGGVPLINVLNRTGTPMGARLLKKWVVLPLKDRAVIENRQRTVEACVEQEPLHHELLQLLKPLGDIERLISKVAAGRVNPREMAQLKRALQAVKPIKKLLLQAGIARLATLADQLHTCDFLLERIERELQAQPPLVSNQGNLINDGIDIALDELRQLAYSGKDYLRKFGSVRCNAPALAR